MVILAGSRRPAADLSLPIALGAALSAIRLVLDRGDVCPIVLADRMPLGNRDQGHHG
jgi:hypothetical protein